MGVHGHDLPLTCVRRAYGQPEFTTYAYDAARHPTRVTNGAGDATVLSYDGLGRLVGEQWPNGTVVARGYDLMDRLLSERTTGSDGRGAVTDLAWLEWVRDERGRVREQHTRWLVDAAAP